MTISNISDINIAKYKKEAYATKQKELENYVSVALNTIDTFYQRSSKAKIKQEVQNNLRERMSQVFNLINNLFVIILLI